MDYGPQWFSFSHKEIAKKLKTNFEQGLSSDSILGLQEKYGRNVFDDNNKNPLMRIFVGQFKNPLVLILLIAGLVTLFVGEYVDTTVIFLALAINIGIGVYQERRASRAFEKLKESQQKHALVLRNGKKISIPSENVVPGDIIFLESGKLIPADARLIEGQELIVNESALTGEWIGVSKDENAEVKKSSITEQVNMVWMGTAVSGGIGKAVVVATGNRTQIGKIALSLLEEEEEATPLQKNIRKITKFLALAIVGIIIVLVTVGLLGGASTGEMLLIAVAIAVAAIPEGLPAAVTVVLALGMEAILKKNGLVRNLLAAETLGSTTIILTDKTGTLTEAKMKIAFVTTLSSLSGDFKENEPHDASFSFRNDDEKKALERAILSSDAFVEWKEEKGKDPAFIVRGRPIEKAIVTSGLEHGIHQDVLLKEYPRIDLLPFNSRNKFVASLHEEKDMKSSRVIFVGAPEILLKKATSVFIYGHKEALSEEVRKQFLVLQEEESGRGSRIIGIGYKDVRYTDFSKDMQTGKETPLENITFMGFIVLHDPIRKEVAEAIHKTHASGIRVIMLTGDHHTTARYVADTVGIRKKGDRVMVGEQIENLNDKDLLRALNDTSVFARTLPQQKLRIVRLLKSRGEVVAMTGDGVNDAPALYSADIGISLGSGTDVAKEASDLVLLDDSFNIIVYAIEEGRRIVDNLKKITAYLLSTGFSEVFIVGSALLMGAPLPLLPVQILWINIIGEGFMSVALAFEPKEKNIMKRKPQLVGSTILTKNLKKLILTIALITGVFLIALYFILLKVGFTIEKIRTIMFVALSIDSLLFSFSLKDLHEPIWRIKIFSNKYLIVAFIGSIAMLLAALFVPPLQRLLSFESFSREMFYIIIGLGIFNLLLIEISKYIIFKKR